MIPAALGFATACFGVALILTLVRLLRGPDTADRILALDTMAIHAIALLVLHGIARNSPFAFEPALLLAMVSFVGTVGFCRYLLRGTVFE